jgi:hypothetical protein
VFDPKLAVTSIHVEMMLSRTSGIQSFHELARRDTRFEDDRIVGTTSRASTASSPHLQVDGKEEALGMPGRQVRGRCRWIFGGCLMLGLVVPMESIAAEPEAARINVRGDLLDAEVSAVPLGDVLRAVAEKAGFEIETRGDLGEVRPQSFEGVALEDGIRRLVDDNRVNLIMRYEVDEAGKRRLVEVTARAAGEVPAELLEQRRMRVELARIRVPPPPPPPPAQ